jgi:hypothetical protein
MPSMKAARILSENVAALLRLKGYKQTDLAQWCKRSDPWVSQFLRGERTWQLDDLDKVADFFGLNTYDLFRPGIAQRTDRRSGQRRVIKDRRVRHDVRMAQQLEAQIETARPHRKDLDGDRSTAAAAQARQLHALIADFARRVSTLIPSTDTGGQTPSPRARRATISGRHRGAHGSDPEAS